MKTLEQIRDRRLQLPMSVSWYLSDIGRAQGLQDLYTRQSPQRLKVLREHAIAQSVISSNRIEGVEIDQTRVGTVVFGHPALNDRGEEEVAGYRDALNLIHTRRLALADIEKACPGVGRDWIRALLFDLKKTGGIRCTGKGRAARWLAKPE